MREDLKILEKIDQYLAGRMSGAELSAFEKDIQKNPALKAQVDNQQLIIQAAKRQVLSNQINAVAKSGGSFFKFNWTLGIGLIFLLVAIITYTQFDIDKPSDGENIEISVSGDITETEIIGVSNNQIEEEVIVDTLPKTKNTIQPPFKAPKVDKTSAPDFEFYDFNGLKCWVEPTVQTFEIDANITETIEGQNGTLIIVPENSFLDENGNQVNGKVNFELVEAYELSDIVLYNLTTTSNGNVLETGGMFYTNATQNGQQLTVDPANPMMIQIPCIEEKSNMMAFESEIDTAGNINWKKPKPLEQFLTKVDMNLLDFLPVGFENEVHASMPIVGLEKANSQEVDKLYYSLKISEKIKRLSGKEFRKLSRLKKENYLYLINQKGVFETEEYWIVSKDFDCGINPLSIKTIKENIDYSNSFVATKEFEERLVELHKLENGQKMFDVYLENLDKNLWYSDSIVAEMVINKRNDPAFKDKGNVLNLSNRDRKKNVFDNFFNQRKTKVRDADLYSEALTKYYNVKKQAYKDEMEKIRKKTNSQLAIEIKKLEKLSQSKNKTNIQNNAITNLNVSRGKNYTVAWASFGWANIDSYLHMLDKDSKEVEITANNGEGKMRLYQWLGAISTLTPIIVNQFKGIVKFPQAGSDGSLKMKNTYTMAISNNGDKWFFGAKRYNPYQTNGIDVDLAETTISQIKIKLKQFNGTTPLMKHLNEDIKRMKGLSEAKEMHLKLQKEVFEEQQREDAFINRLKKLCFLCYSDTEIKEKPNSSESSPLRVKK